MTSVHSTIRRFSRKHRLARVPSLRHSAPLCIEALGFVWHLQYPLAEPDASQPGSNVGLDESGRGLPALLVGPILARGLLLLQEAALGRRALRAEHPRALDHRSAAGRRARTTPGRLRFATATATPSSSSSSSLAANREASPRHSHQLTGIYRPPLPRRRSSSALDRVERD